MSAGRLTIRRAGYSLPFDVFDRALAQKNHGQTLERLEERGGVSPVEAVSMINWKHWSRFPEGWCVSMILSPLRDDPPDVPPAR